MAMTDAIVRYRRFLKRRNVSPNTVKNYLMPPPVFNEPLLFISVDPGEVAGFGICGGNSADIGGYQRGGNGCSEWVSKGGFP